MKMEMKIKMRMKIDEVFEVPYHSDNDDDELQAARKNIKMYKQNRGLHGNVTQRLWGK